MEYEFLCIARFNFQKGQDVLIRAIAQAQDDLRTNGKRTLFIGGGETFEVCRHLAEELGLADLVDFAGEIPGASSMLNRGRILVSPSRWEGLPILLLEAGKAGKCVIASDCPGNIDVIGDVRYGRLFPEGNVVALADILSAVPGVDEANELGQALQNRVRERFSRSRMLSATEDVYRALAGGGKKDGR